MRNIEKYRSHTTTDSIIEEAVDGVSGTAAGSLKMNAFNISVEVPCGYPKSF
jgi:hypothetical protein